MLDVRLGRGGAVADCCLVVSSYPKPQLRPTLISPETAGFRVIPVSRDGSGLISEVKSAVRLDSWHGQTSRRAAHFHSSTGGLGAKIVTALCGASIAR